MDGAERATVAGEEVGVKANGDAGAGVRVKATFGAAVGEREKATVDAAVGGKAEGGQEPELASEAGMKVADSGMRVPGASWCRGTGLAHKG